MKKLICMFLVLLCIGCNTKKEKFIPAEDKKKIENFLELLVKSYGLAYTLFGDKPCSIATYISGSKFSFDSFILEEGWNCWLKYNSLFPSQNFALKKIGTLETSTIEEIVVINKKATLALLKAHLKVFQQAIGLNLKPEEILNHMLNNNDFLEKLFNSNVLGILLGYGKINAQGFEKRFNLSVALNELSSPPFKEDLEDLDPLNLFFVKGYSLKRFKSNPAFTCLNTQTLKNELKDIIVKLKPFELPGYDGFLERIQSPVFAAIQDDPETIELYKKYSLARQKIIDAYQGKSIFEVTINQWMANSYDS